MEVLKPIAVAKFVQLCLHMYSIVIKLNKEIFFTLLLPNLILILFKSVPLNSAVIRVNFDIAQPVFSQLLLPRNVLPQTL